MTALAPSYLTYCEILFPYKNTRGTRLRQFLLFLNLALLKYGWKTPEACLGNIGEFDKRNRIILTLLLIPTASDLRHSFLV